jgi:hypothetical protein
VRLIHASIVLEVQLIDDLLDLTRISRYATALSPARIEPCLSTKDRANANLPFSTPTGTS